MPCLHLSAALLKRFRSPKRETCGGATEPVLVLKLWGCVVVWTYRKWYDTDTETPTPAFLIESCITACHSCTTLFQKKADGLYTHMNLEYQRLIQHGYPHAGIADLVVSSLVQAKKSVVFLIAIAALFSLSFSATNTLLPVYTCIPSVCKCSCNVRL